MQDFLRAVESQGIPVTDDLQDLKTGHGACHWEKWINRDTGRRSDSAHAYIHSTRAHHSNLHLVCNTKVEKIIMEGGRAVGVKTVPTKPLTPGQDQAKVYRARKQIVSKSLVVHTESRSQNPEPTIHITCRTITDTVVVLGRQWRHIEFSIDPSTLWHRYVSPHCHISII
jgi:hypothetical protein